MANGSRAVFTRRSKSGSSTPTRRNIFYEPDGSLTFIDCGMTGFVDEATRLGWPRSSTAW